MQSTTQFLEETQAPVSQTSALATAGASEYESTDASTLGLVLVQPLVHPLE